ncbi:MAG TPA: cupredoxin domain-containing protein [Patescibacteria group bacterium]|nr:cupredoxin domain-containing protein [Patescibacteria group bacterium]
MQPETTKPPMPETAPTHDAAAQKPTKKGSKSMLPKIMLVIVVVFVALLLALAFTHKTSKQTNANIASKLQKAQISIVSTGFEPATLNITTGTQVTWTNTDSAAHQVAADPYPKDDSISGFDSTVILQNKDTLSYTFNKAGTYSYHDERNPLDLKGTVIVK